MMKQAQKLFDDGQYAEAEAMYREFLEDDAGNAEAVFMLAMARHKQGDLDEALDLLARAAELDADNAHVHYTLGTLHMSRKAVDEARAAYLRALQSDPFYIDAHNGLAFVELTDGNYSAAEKAANLALTEDARNVQALVYLGTAKLEQDDSTKAISYLQEALKEAPDHRSAQIQLGRAFLAAGNAAFAMQCFQNSVDADPDSGLAREYLAIAQFAGGHVHDAASNFRKALSLGRNTPSVVRGLEECERLLAGRDRAGQVTQGAAPATADSEIALTRAEFLIGRGNPVAALKLLERLGGAGAQQAIVLTARAHEQMRDPGAAIAVLEPMVNSGKASDDARLAYARLLMKTGREHEADGWIDALLDQDHPPLDARIFRAFQKCRHGDEAGHTMLRELENEPDIPVVELRRVRKMLAGSLDRAGRYTEAAGYYSLISGRLAQVLPVAQGTATSNRALLASGEISSSPARKEVSDGPADPIFLFAWPGSGWEWLASGLGAHAGLMLVADKPESQVQRRALISSPAGPAELEGFSADDAARAIAQYWADLKSGGLEPGARITLDTMWISADMLPTIATLFPAARVIVLKRDPRDMVMDWFRGGYSDLNNMAVVYAEQLRLLEQYRGLLDIAFIDVDGLRLQHDAEPELRTLLQALELPWDDAVATQLHALAPATASGRGGWRDYREALDQPLAVFAPEFS